MCTEVPWLGPSPAAGHVGDRDPRGAVQSPRLWPAPQWGRAPGSDGAARAALATALAAPGPARASPARGSGRLPRHVFRPASLSF